MRIVLKYDENQPRDELGRFGSTGGEKVGQPTFDAPRTATVERKSMDEFRKMPQKDLEKAVAAAIKSPGGNTIQGIYSHMAQAYGLAPGLGVAKVVDKTLQEMGKRGLIEVKKETLQERHGKKVEGLTAGMQPKGGSVKWAYDKETGTFSIKEREQFTISLKGKEFQSVSQLPTPTHTLGVERPDRFEPVKGGLAEQALELRRLDYPDTKISPMGRYFSSSKDSPEMMLGDDKQAKGKFNRNEYFEKKGIFFFDATSSVTAHVGAMTGDIQSLTMSKLMPQTEKPAHHDTMVKLGIKEKDTGKPYFSSFSGKHLITEADFAGVKVSPHDIKDLAKSLWTPGSYGSPPGAMHIRLSEKLNELGIKGDANKALRTKLVENFKETAMYKFTPALKSVVSEAPHNFVYTNPMSGFRMSFNEYDLTRHRTEIAGERINSMIPTQVARDRSGNLKLGSAAPLFIQNWDAAVIGQLMKDMKSTATAHDAIGVKKSEQKKLNTAVVKAMNMVKKFNPIQDLANQIMKQHLKNGMPKKEYNAMKKRLQAKVATITKNTNKVPDFVVNPDTGNNHFQPEF